MEEFKIIFFVILTILTYIQAKRLKQDPLTSSDKTKALESQTLSQKDEAIGKDQHTVAIKQQQKIAEMTLQQIMDIDNQLFAQFQQKTCKVKKYDKKQARQFRKGFDAGIENSFDMMKYSKGKMFEMQQSRIIYDTNYFHKSPFQKQQTFNNTNFSLLEPNHIIRTNNEYLSNIEHFLKPYQEERCGGGMNQSMCIQTNNTNNSMMEEQSNNVLQSESHGQDQNSNKHSNKLKIKSIKKKKKSQNKSNQQTKLPSGLFLNSNKNSIKRQNKLYNHKRLSQNWLDLQEEIEKRELQLKMLKNIKLSRSNNGSK